TPLRHIPCRAVSRTSLRNSTCGDVLRRREGEEMMQMSANIQLAESKANDALGVALRHAGRGRPIFPLWPRYGDKCACGDAGCKSHGKHPLGDLVPKGFKDATTDEKTIN